jgi:hypothetical protein
MAVEAIVFQSVTTLLAVSGITADNRTIIKVPRPNRPRACAARDLRNLPAY